jgi:putative nucleotidyltransferase with HDIG domain
MNDLTFPTVTPKTTHIEAGTLAHCRRVAAWSEEVARALHLPPAETMALSQAALAHHWPDVMSGPGLCRILDDLGIGGMLLDPNDSRSMADAILLALQNPNSRTGRIGELAAIVEAANWLDESLEYAPYQDVADLAGSDWCHETAPPVIQQLRMATPSDLKKVLPKLPVYPAAAMRLFRLLSNEEINLTALEDVACMDQVIAGRLLEAANSVYYSPRVPIRTVAHAVSFVGTRDASRILLAATIQPLFSSARMRRLWKHALEAGQTAERIAVLTGKVDPAEAFLLGLLHDVGKLAIAHMSPELNDAIERLLNKGCQPATAEMVLCGFDHATASAEVLQRWKFAEELVTAVRDHHQPEKTSSTLAAVLYLTEFWTDSEEDLPSHARLSAALKLSSLTLDSLDSNLLSRPGVFTSL